MRRASVLAPGALTFVSVVLAAGCLLSGCFDEQPTSREALALDAPETAATGQEVVFTVQVPSRLTPHAVEVIDQQLGSDLLLAALHRGGSGSFQGSWLPYPEDEGPYSLKAKVVLDSGEVLHSPAVSMEVQLTEPYARKGPTGLAAVAGDGAVALSWDAEKRASGYHVYRGLESGFSPSAATRIASVVEAGHVDEEADNGTTYYYLVTSYTLNQRSGRVHESAASVEASASPGPGSTADSTPPTVSITSPVTDGTYTSVKTVTIVAEANDDTAVSKVEFYDGDSLQRTDTVAPYTHSWSLSAAENGEHAWTAKAYDTSGNSATSSARLLTVNIPSSPPAPSGVQAVAGDAKNTISWSPVSGATTYNLYWALTSGVTKTNANKVAGVSSPYTHSALINGLSYYYVVTAVNSAGEGPSSAQVSAKPQAAPDTTAPSFGGLASATAKGDSSILLGWSPAADNVTPSSGIVYQIHSSTSPSVDLTAPVHTTAAGATSYLLTGLAPGTTYYFVVRARDAAGNVDPNTVIKSATTQSSTPAGPQPPFGSTVGVTAENFTIPQCDNTPFELHQQYDKQPATVIFFNKTSFT